METARYEVTEARRAALAVPADQDTPDCPTCGRATWDRRLTKREADAPDYVCRDRACGGAIYAAAREAARA